MAFAARNCIMFPRPGRGSMFAGAWTRSGVDRRAGQSRAACATHSRLNCRLSTGDCQLHSGREKHDEHRGYQPTRTIAACGRGGGHDGRERLVFKQEFCDGGVRRCGGSAGRFRVDTIPTADDRGRVRAAVLPLARLRSEEGCGVDSQAELQCLPLSHLLLRGLLSQQDQASAPPRTGRPGSAAGDAESVP